MSIPCSFAALAAALGLAACASDAPAPPPATPAATAAEPVERYTGPVIDMHLHALPANWFGAQAPAWAGEHQPATSDDALRDGSIAALERNRVVKAVASGPKEFVDAWHRAAPDRIVRALMVVSEDCATLAPKLEAWVKSGEVEVLGEVGWQYAGRETTDPALAPCLELAERLGLPLALHLGLGPPGAAHDCCSEYRAGHGNPLQLEDTLVKHPKLRVYVMHAGWPMLDEMVAVMHAFPNVYVDVAVLDWYLPREEFDASLQRLLRAGLGKRVMFGSDQMVWPTAIDAAIERINGAPYLSLEQKRDILHDNAQRFLSGR